MGLHKILHCKHGGEENWPAQRNLLGKISTKGKKWLPPQADEKSVDAPLAPWQCASGHRGYYCSLPNPNCTRQLQVLVELTSK